MSRDGAIAARIPCINMKNIPCINDQRYPPILDSLPGMKSTEDQVQDASHLTLNLHQLQSKLTMGGMAPWQFHSMSADAKGRPHEARAGETPAAFQRRQRRYDETMAEMQAANNRVAEFKLDPQQLKVLVAAVRLVQPLLPSGFLPVSSTWKPTAAMCKNTSSMWLIAPDARSRTRGLLFFLFISFNCNVSCFRA